MMSQVDHIPWGAQPFGFPAVAVTKQNRGGGLNNGNHLTPLEAVSPPEASLLGLQTAAFSTTSRGVFTSTSVPPSNSAHVSLFRKNGSQIGAGPTLMPSFQPKTLCKDPISKHGHILRHWGPAGGLGREHTPQLITAINSVSSSLCYTNSSMSTILSG